MNIEIKSIQMIDIEKNQFKSNKKIYISISGERAAGCDVWLVPQVLKYPKSTFLKYL